MANSAAFRARKRDTSLVPPGFLFDTENPDYILHIQLRADEEYNMSMYEKGLESC